MRLILAILVVCGCARLAAGEVVEIDRLYQFDAVRGRNLGVKIYLPAEGTGPLPVVLVSHGLGGSQWGYGYLGRHLAEHGYVSIHCTHPGSDWLLWDGKGFGAGVVNMRKANEDSVNWRERPRDLSFLIDHLPDLATQAPELAERMDPGRIAVVGHSLGAYTALALAGLRPCLPEGPVDLADARPRAFVAMSPQGSGGFLPPGCWAGIMRPVLLITGTADEQPFDKTDHGLAWRLEAWGGIPDGAKSLLVLDGATHMTFAGGGLGEKADPARLTAVCTAVTAFLDASLGGKPFEPPAVVGGKWDAAQPERAR